MTHNKKNALPSEETILLYLRARLTEKRVTHAIGTRDIGAMLAEKHGANEEKVIVACLLHDAAKAMSLEEMKLYLKKRPVKNMPKDAFSSAALLHGVTARAIAEHEFKITDSDVLEAIAYHTTGNANLSLTAKIVYLADYLDPNRDVNETDALLALALIDLNAALLYVVGASIAYVVEKKRYLSPLSVTFYNETLERL